MRVLLDTHAFLWWLVDSARLSRVACQVIADKGIDILVTAALAKEITAKHRLDRFPGVLPPRLESRPVSPTEDLRGWR